MENKIIKLLEKKGIIASLVGFLLVAPINGFTIYRFFADKGLTENQERIFIVCNLVGIFWVMLPSSIKLISKAFTLEVTD